MSDTPDTPAEPVQPSRSTNRSTNRSHGRIAVRPTLKPRELMTDRPDLAKAWTARVITLLPQAFPGILGESLIGKALEMGKWQLKTYALRDHGVGKHRNVDDTPAGGGAGMVIRPDVMAAALDEALTDAKGLGRVIYLSPRGRKLDQQMAQELALTDGVTLICGRFEGLDQRVIDHYNMMEVSLGDFVMTGGELAAQALIDATVRLIPGVLGNETSTEEESFSDHLLEHPQYTRPAIWRDLPIPEILMSGHHGKIAEWRKDMAQEITQERRPDLWAAYCAKYGIESDNQTD